MKTLSLNLLDRLTHLLFTRAKNAGPKDKTINTAKRNSFMQSASEGRKAYTGNFFAGPHSIFDPRLFTVTENNG
ncbi:hypothetical protein [Foetidibacter luteolus]|uniref:hypothetical protein n=1 Tax=Foetidibacter luteolus TaxID=2608880 RepID=UPI00129B03A9|nr:hypothetical protein [Foetidibacter luteolus]